MIEPRALVEALEELGVDFATGVPDSLMEPLCTYLAMLPGDRHAIAANEGAAVGIAIGHYLSTGSPALVYLQNAGIGNAINPLVSLADPDVYGIPMLLLVGWRGQPGNPDEPQHVKQGQVMEPLLEALDIPWETLPKDGEKAVDCLARAFRHANERATPYVLMVEKGTFSPVERDESSPARDLGLASREDALIALLDATGDEAAYVVTTGMLGRELYEHRERSATPADRDFLTVGGMGHCSSIALGVAQQRRDREVWCLDGDGSALMHLGSLAVIGHQAPENLYHVVFNNGVHDSVGGQPTVMPSVDLPGTARALGYRFAASVSDISTLGDVVSEMREHSGPCLLDLQVRHGNRDGIGRPARTPSEAKTTFMAGLD